MSMKTNILREAVKTKAETNGSGFKAGTVANAIVDDFDGIRSRAARPVVKTQGEAIEAMQSMAEGVLAASDKLTQVHADLSERTKRSVSKAKDAAQQMTDAMNRLTKQLGPDFEARLQQLERLTECMEKLSALQKDGRLESVMTAMAKGK
jgi:methyl-accepting chemotaxis protein